MVIEADKASAQGENLSLGVYRGKKDWKKSFIHYFTIRY